MAKNLFRLIELAGIGSKRGARDRLHPLQEKNDSPPPNTRKLHESKGALSFLSFMSFLLFGSSVFLSFSWDSFIQRVL